MSKHPFKTFVRDLSVPESILMGSVVGSLITGIIIGGSIFGAAAHTNRMMAGTAGVVAVAGQQTAPANTATGVAVDSSKVKTANDPVVGNPNAAVTVAYWFDYQCPFCKRAEQQVTSQLIADYIKTGKVKVVFKDYAFLGPDSLTAASAGRAVWAVDPTRFYAWHKAMFDKQDAENSGWGKKADIIALTGDILGLAEADKVSNLMDTQAAAYSQQITDNRVEGGTMGVKGTPAFIIGTQFISGAQPYDVIKAAVDAALAKVK